MIQQLANEFERWDNYFSGLSPEERVLILYGNRTNKDELAHLWEWQRMSHARLYAVVNKTEPDFSYWPEWFETITDDEALINKINEWVYEKNLNRDWKDIYQDWKKTTSQVLELAEQIPEEIYYQRNKFTWLGDYTLSDVLIGSYNHYHLAHWPNILKK